MQAFVLITVLAAAFWIQHVLDARQIHEAARGKRWSVSRITWAPIVRLLSGSRWERCYWLRYQSEDGRTQRRLCRIGGVLHIGAFVAFEPEVQELRSDGRAIVSPFHGLGRWSSVVLFAAVGAFLGVALGIAVCILFFPPSNILPAYGVIFGTPAGTFAGAIFGAVRRLS